MLKVINISVTTELSLHPFVLLTPAAPRLLTSLQVVTALGGKSDELFITGFKYFQYDVSLYNFLQVSCLWNVLSSLDVCLYCFHQFGNFQPLFFKCLSFLPSWYFSLESPIRHISNHLKLSHSPLRLC